MTIYRLQKTERDHIDKKRRSSVTEKGQGHTGNRHYPHGHSQVDERVEYEHAHQTYGHGAAFGLTSAVEGDYQRPDTDEHIREDYKNRDLEAQLFAHDGKNKVGMTFRNESPLTLVAFAQSGAGDTAGANRDQTLQDVIAGSPRVGIGIDETGQSFLLVLF